MSEIVRLTIAGVRNIESVDIKPSSTVNFLFGENGSGKTSFLEAIYLLSSGRSFRSAKIDPLIAHGIDEAVVFAEMASGYHMGLSKSRRQNHQLHFQNESQKNWENVARELPVQLLDSNSFLLLEGGPRMRRRFIDWGVFHVEQNFLLHWRRSRKCLANRNFLLKQRKVDAHQLAAWDVELSEAAIEIDRTRLAYVDALIPKFRKVYKELDSDLSGMLTLRYTRGWEQDRELVEVLADTVHTDTRYGATQQGPHRAELEILLGKARAVDIMSRGQQKVLVSALKIAQGELLSTTLGRRCVYLVDDLPAELDTENRAAVLGQLLGQGGQVFVTCVEKNALIKCLPNTPDMALFHVERGTITA